MVLLEWFYEHAFIFIIGVDIFKSTFYYDVLRFVKPLMLDQISWMTVPETVDAFVFTWMCHFLSKWLKEWNDMHVY